MSKVRLYMGIPSVNTRSDAQCYVLRDLQDRYGDKIEFVYPEQYVQRIFHDAARNGIVEDFLESGCDVLWFLDSDIAPPKHVLDLITIHWDEWTVSGAPYPIFMSCAGMDGPQIVFTAYNTNADGNLVPSKIPYQGTANVAALATGCLFIKKEVFKTLEQPYFEFKYDPKTRAMVEGEDLGFCMKLAKLGVKFFTDFSMVCKHYKHVDLLELNNYAIDYANTAVKAYDAEVKDKVRSAVNAAYQKGKKDVTPKVDASTGRRMSPNGILL